MPKSDFADITLVLDRSGSMESIADDTVGGVARFLADQKAAPGSAVFTLVQFDHEYAVVHRAVPLAAVPPFTRRQFVPRGSTALLDAVGRAVVETGERLAALPEPDRPGSVVFVIVTDGLENASKEYTRDRVFAMIRHQQEAYSWTFLFLGANQDAIAAGAGLGVAASHAMTYTSGAVGSAYASVSKAVLRGRSGARLAGFTAEDRQKQGD